MNNKEKMRDREREREKKKRWKNLHFDTRFIVIFMRDSRGIIWYEFIYGSGRRRAGQGRRSEWIIINYFAALLIPPLAMNIYRCLIGVSITIVAWMKLTFINFFFLCFFRRLTDILFLQRFGRYCLSNDKRKMCTRGYRREGRSRTLARFTGDE